VRVSQYTEQSLRDAVSKSFSWSSVCRLVGVKPATGSQTYLTKKCKNLGIDSSHFTGRLWSKGKKLGSKRPIEDYLSNKVFIGSHSLKLRLWKDGLKPKFCEVCRFFEWMGKEIPLELDHIDSNHDNNSLDNLMILCPTCHAQKTRHERKIRD
jgi:5-methylcytosine-specific restriction endonuclease McrA